MVRHSLLLVDADPKSQKVLEVSLRNAGYLVTTAFNGLDALEKINISAPDLILSDTKMPVMDGFEFCSQLKENQAFTKIPFIFLTNQNAVEDKIRGLNLGVEDYLTKPIYIKEVVTRINIVLQKKEREALGRQKASFAGMLTDMGVVDLIQTIDVNRKSGIIHFLSEQEHNRSGQVFFRSGKVIDAEVGKLRGEEAVYRLLLWREGSFQIEFHPLLDHPDQIDASTQALLMEGLRRVDEWGRIAEQLPAFHLPIEISASDLSEKRDQLPDELNSILRLIDGQKNISRIVDECDLEELDCLAHLSKLYFEGIIHEIVPSEPNSPAPTQEASVFTYDDILLNPNPLEVTLSQAIESLPAAEPEPAPPVQGESTSAPAPQLPEEPVQSVSAATGLENAVVPQAQLAASPTQSVPLEKPNKVEIPDVLVQAEAHEIVHDLLKQMNPLKLDPAHKPSEAAPAPSGSGLTFKAIFLFLILLVASYCGWLVWTAYLNQEESSAELKQVDNLPKKNQDSSIDYEAQLQKGRVLFRRGVHEEAIAAYLEAIQRNPQGDLAMAELAQIYVELEKFDQANSFAKRALEQNPHSALAHYVMGVVFQRQQDTEKATEYYQKFLELSPEGKLADDVRRILKEWQP